MTLQARTLANVASMENIKMDLDHPLGKGIETIVGRVIAGTTSLKDSADQLTDHIQKCTNLNITYQWINRDDAYCEHQDLDRNHPFFSFVIKDAPNEFLPDMGQSHYGQGTVDLKTGRVSGSLSKISFKLVIGRYQHLIKKTKDPKQIARRVTAIVLHEIGHAFTYCLYFGRSAVTNLVLLEASARWQGADEKARVEILEKIEKSDVVTKVDVEKLSKQKNGEMVYFTLLNQHFCALEDELHLDMYSQRGCEALADQFATRLGYGADLAHGLADSSDMGSLPIFFGIRSLFYQSGLLYAAIAGFAPAGFIAAFAVTLGLLAEAVSPTSGAEYDTPKRRLEVIRNELRRFLAKPLPTEARSKILEDIAETEIAIENVREYKILNIGILETGGGIYNLLFPTGRSRQRSMAFQKRLEDLMSSKLYETSARLENLV